MANERACRVCSTAISRFSKYGFCRPCARRNRGSMPVEEFATNCIDCGVGLCKINRSGRCKLCFNQAMWKDPQFRQNRLVGIRRKFAEPEYAEKMSKKARRLAQLMAIDPEIQARKRELGKIAYQKNLAPPEVRARAIAAVRRAGPTHTELRLGWCPQEFRERYSRLVNSKKMKAADARAIIEQEIADQQALKHIPSALEHLRRLAPVQVLENGYRYGNAILRPSEVIERAKLRGWQPERWAA